jgi:hypothetical protein
MRAIRRGATPPHLHLRNRLIKIAAVSIAVDLAGSVLILLFERNADRTEIHTFGDSVFWTTTQLLTVSSQLPNPISTGGRITDVFLQFYAISFIALLAGALAAFFNHRSHDRRRRDWTGQGPTSRATPHEP